MSAKGRPIIGNDSGMCPRYRFKLSVVLSGLVYSALIVILARNVWVPLNAINNENDNDDDASLNLETEHSTFRRNISPNKIPDKIVLEPKLLTLFTTWKASMESSYVYNNTVNVLSTMGQDIQPVIFLPEEDIAFYDPPKGWDVLPISASACGGAPVLKNMFLDAYKKFDSTFYGYVNADILFNKGILETLRTIKSSKVFNPKKSILISGRRFDIQLEKLGVKHISTPMEVEEIVLKVSLQNGFAEDYFITTSTYPWQFMLDLVIGRPKYDNYLVYTSRIHKVLVIDASSTVIALHQRTKKRKKSKHECNEAILRKAKRYSMWKIRRGALECAKLETRYDRDGNVTLIRRGQFTVVC